MDAAVREKNLALLAEGTNALLDSVAGVSEEQARMRPVANRWSVLECVKSAKCDKASGRLETASAVQFLVRI